MKAGIVCDNYKVRKFKRALIRKGLEPISTPFTLGTTVITVEVDNDQLLTVRNICYKLQIDFKQSN